MKTSIVIPVFGAESFLTSCLQSIHDNTSSAEYELILVDNGTGYDMTADVVIRNAENQGYGIATNQGCDAAGGDVLVLLNVDTEVQPGWLTTLLSAFEDPSVVMAGPRIIHPDGSLQTAGIRTWHGNGSAGGEEIKQDLPTRDVDGVTGACMAIRHKTFDELGKLDNAFVNGYEDVALCLSAREAGHRIRYVAGATIVHHESAAGGEERWRHCARNVQIMNEKWGSI